MEEPRTIEYKDRMYPPKVVEEISRLRHERWAILAAVSHSKDDTQTIYEMTASRERGFRHRLKFISERLYKLTGNKIYVVK